MIALVLSYLGWTLLSGATDRHRRSWPVAVGRIGGAAALLAAFAASVAAEGWHIGPVYWCAALSASAAMHVLFLWYTRRRLSKQRR